MWITLWQSSDHNYNDAKLSYATDWLENVQWLGWNEKYVFINDPPLLILWKLRRTWYSRGVGLLSCQHNHTPTHVWYKSKRFKMISQSCVQKHWCVAVPEKPQQRHSHWTWSNQQSTTMRQYTHPKPVLLCLYTCNNTEMNKAMILLLNLTVKLTGWEVSNTATAGLKVKGILQSFARLFGG